MKRFVVLFLLTILIYSCKDSTLHPGGGEEKIPVDYAKVIFYVKQGDSLMELHRYYVDNGEDIILKRGSALSLLNKPINNRLYYLNDTYGYSIPLKIYSCDLNGKNEKLHFTFKDGSRQNIQFSNDGTKLAYTTVQGNVYSVHLADINGAYDNVVNTNNYFVMYEFTSDSRNLILAPLGLTLYSNIYCSEISDGTLKNSRKINNDSLKTWFYGFSENCSPDNKYFALMKDYQDIILMNIQNGDTITILKNSKFLYGLKWSPDGSKICYWRDAGTFCVINSDGTNEINLTNIGQQLVGINHLASDWSGDNKHILFSINTIYGEVNCGDLRIADISTGVVSSIVNSQTVYSAFFLK